MRQDCPCVVAADVAVVAVVAVAGVAVVAEVADAVVAVVVAVVDAVVVDVVAEVVAGGIGSEVLVFGDVEGMGDSLRAGGGAAGSSSSKRNISEIAFMQDDVFERVRMCMKAISWKQRHDKRHET